MAVDINLKQNVIDEIFVDGVKFNGFPGKCEVSPGVKYALAFGVENSCTFCDVTLTRVTGKAADGVSWSLLIPYPQEQAKLAVWCAREGYPKALFDIGGTKLYYGDVCYGTVIPMVSLYNREAGIGLSVAKAPGRIGGRLSFAFDDYHGDGMWVNVENLAVPAGKSVTFRLFFFGHEACWRPGLQQYIELFPEYFAPVAKSACDCRSFVMTTPFFKRETTLQLDSDWAEIHNHFPFYGNYMPQEASWQSVIGNDYPQDAAGRDITVDRAKIKNHIKDLKDAGVKSLLYVQCGGDADCKWVEKTFSESIARDSAGHNYPTWIGCCFANGDGTPFGKFLDRQLDEIFEVYPEVDGFFVDQLCYQCVDYAHSDGKSAVGGREVYEYGASLEKKFRAFAEKAHRAGKIVLVNGPFDMDISKGADGIMSEGTSTIFETYRYLCVRRPMLVHEFPTDTVRTETMLRCCLLAAAGWSVGGTASCEKPLAWSDEVAGLYRQYLPLIKELFGSQILLTPDPVRCSPEALAQVEIFRCSKDEKEYFVPVISKSAAIYSGVDVSVKVPQKIKSARVMYVGSDSWQDIGFEEKDGRSVFKLHNGFNACLLKLSAE